MREGSKDREVELILNSLYTWLPGSTCCHSYLCSIISSLSYFSLNAFEALFSLWGGGEGEGRGRGGGGEGGNCVISDMSRECDLVMERGEGDLVMERGEGDWVMEREEGDLVRR